VNRIWIDFKFSFIDTFCS